jgi:hypothetical protein
MKKRFLHRKVVRVLLIALFPMFAISASAQTNYYVSTAGSDLTGNGTFGNPYATIQKAVDISASGDIVNIAAGTYPESVTVSKSLTIQGVDSATVILDKGDGNYNANNGNNGFTVSANNVTIKLLKIRNYNHAVTNSASVSNLTINQCTLLDNFNTGFYSGAAFNGLTISNCIMRYNGNRYNISSGGIFRRAVFLQQGGLTFTNLVMTSNIVTNNGLVGLDLNLAASISGVTITGNTLSGNGDAELSVWLGASTPTSNAVLIDNNNITITNTGRFGIEIKNPNGTGSNAGVGSVVVSNNIINVSSHTGATRDMGGIVVIRRKDATASVNDQPQGVVISGNTINDLQNININTNDAYAIAVGGTGHKILNNTITNAEVSIQLQKGNDNYLTDNNSDQALVNFYFSRDNSKDVCVEMGTNTITSSGAPRLVTAAAVSSLTLPVQSTSNATLGTNFCTLQQAIDFAATTTGHTVTGPTATYSENIVLKSGVILSTGTANWVLTGNLTNNGGTIDDVSGTITLGGGSLQTITGGGSFKNLILNNATGAVIASGVGNTVNITGTYTPTAGTLTTNGNLTIKSSATETGRIAAGTGTYISGTVTQERFVPAKASRTWSLLASPFSQSIASSWQQQIHITGTGTGGTVCPTLTLHSNGFDATGINTASMFVYDGTKAVNTRWTSVTGTASVNLTAGTGYRVNVRGPRSAGCGLLDGTITATSDATLSSSGTLSAANKNAGSFTIDYSNNGDASVANDNYLLIGNPYPSQISFAQLRTDNSTKIGTSYAIYGPANAIGNYAYWDGATFTGANTGLNNATGDIIANGQAVFVQSSIAGGNITALAFNENQKIATANNGYFRTEPNPNMIRIGYMLDNGNKADEIIIKFANNGTTEQLNEHDIISMNTGSQNLKSVKGERQMAINTRPLNFIADTVALNLASTSNGTFKFHFSDFEKLAADIYLIDRYTNTVQKINDQNDVSFSVNTSIPETKGSNRFAVVFSKKQPVMVAAAATIKAYPNPVTDAFVVTLPETSSSYSIKLTDAAGKSVRQLKTVGGNVTIDVSKFSTGTFFLEVTNDKGIKSVQKIVKQ